MALQNKKIKNAKAYGRNNPVTGQHVEIICEPKKNLKNNLKYYKYVGIARADVKEGGKGEYSAIFYNTDKYAALINETFWLSITPEKPSRGWDASLNRICTYVLLKSNSSGERFWIFNTHFDHIGQKAREKSAELILENINSINKENLPLFLMGDFNLIPAELPIQLIVEQLNDSQESLINASLDTKIVEANANGLKNAVKEYRCKECGFMARNMTSFILHEKETGHLVGDQDD